MTKHQVPNKFKAQNSICESIELIKIPTHVDARGNLSFIEVKDYVNWKPKRIYYVTDVKGVRGGHAVIGEKKIYVCAQGQVKAKIHDGKKWHEFNLKGPSDALLMSAMCWREFSSFSANTVLIAISNMNYEKEKYIYDFEKFLAHTKQL